MRLIFIVLILVIGPKVFAQTHDFNKPQTFLNYADHLADDGDYYRAIGEYKRVLYYFPRYEKLNWVKFQIGRMYFLGARYEQAKSYLIPLTFEEQPDQRLDFYVKNFLALSYFENKEFINARRLFAELGKSQQKQVKPLDYSLYEILSIANMNKFSEAKALLEKQKSLFVQEKKTYAKFYKKANEILEEGAGLSRKSPGWAIFWGTILPGGGHLYLKQWDNALVSFLLVGSTALLAYDGFLNERAVQAAIFTTLGSGFYIGSVYSSYRGARVYNRYFGRAVNKQLVKEFKLLNLRINRQLSF